MLGADFYTARVRFYRPCCVARMETDTITAILFVVITLVVFAMPMVVYMECREKIEESFSRRKRRDTPAVETRRTATGTEHGCATDRLAARLSRRAEKCENHRFVGYLAPGRLSGRGILPL